MRSPVKWAPQEITRFYRGFHKYGTEFDKVSKMVGGGKAPDMCEALYRQHQAYLSLEKKYQTEVAFVAMVQDAFNHLKEESSEGGANQSGGGPLEAVVGSDGEMDEIKQPISDGGGARGSRGRIGRHSSGDLGDEGAEDVVGNEQEMQEDEEESFGGSIGGVGRGRRRSTTASTLPKRTPTKSVLRTPPRAKSVRHTPQSSSKRPRTVPRDDDIYEYYDPDQDVVTESARKRRASAKRLDFHQHSLLSAGAALGGGGGRRREAAEEAKGIDALLSLAVAGEEISGGALSGQEASETESEGGRGSNGGSYRLPHHRHSAHHPRQQQQQQLRSPSGRPLRSPAGRPVRSTSLHSPLGRRSMGDMEEVRGRLEGEDGGGGSTDEDLRQIGGMGVEEEEEEDLEAGALDNDEEDEDYMEVLRSRRRRVTPTGTPQRSQRSRPSSTHVTPRRTGLRGLGSPGLRGLGSPAWLGLSDTELGMGELAIPDLSYLSSPGFVAPLPPGYVPSPKNPMPRLRRRKYAPTKSPPVISPIKGLFGSRRQSLAGAPPPPSLLTAAVSGLGSDGGGYGGAGPGSAGATAAAGAEGGSAVPPVEAQLRHCLNARARRWCQFEFFYSAIDRPWFMQNQLQAALTHLGLGHVAKLTRAEWNILRAGLGKPRRLSTKFLKEQRAALEAWRESVRTHYASVAAAADSPAGGEQPATATAANLPRALNVGQRVTARHPSTRQLHDGSVLTAAPHSYRIQFDRRELGVELVRDCDIMPADPAENLPTALLAANPLLLLNGRYVVGGQSVRPPAPRTIVPLTFPSLQAGPPSSAASALHRPAQHAHQQAVHPAVAGQLSPVQQPVQQRQQPHTQQAQQQQQANAASPLNGVPAAARAPDSAQRATMSAAEAQALAELAVNLDKKEALLVHLRAMNDEAAAGVHAVRGGAPGSAGKEGDTSHAFKLAYAKVLLQLRETNDRMASKLLELDALRRGEGTPHLKQEPAGATPPGVQAMASPPTPDTAESLAAAALLAARALVASCRRKLADAAAEDTSQRGADAGDGSGSTPAAPVGNARSGAPTSQPVDWAAPPGRLLGGVIEGCVWSLVALQKGCSGAAPAPAAALAGALDTALTAVRPHAVGNQQLYNEIRQAMEALRTQLLLAG